ncbi:MAG TPA: hypothetical protein VMT37_08835 [Solirubrobacterales bacterium]|nr:hypothetical protein [Solirubrobacterales bacterium]
MRRRLLLAASSALLLAGLLPAAAGAAIYWGGDSFIGAANLDGTKALISYPYEIVNAPPQTHVCGVAVNGSDVFWADPRDNTIGRMELSPNPAGRLDYLNERVAVDEALISNVEEPCGIAVDAGHIYWASAGGLSIGRANLDGSGVERNLVVGLSRPCGIAVDGQHLYWSDVAADTIGRANLDGSDPEREFIVGVHHPCGVAVTADHLYWTGESPRGIGRADLDGGAVDDDFIPLTDEPCGIAATATHLYWANRFQPGPLVSSATIDGSEVHPLVTEPSYAASCGVAIDSRVFGEPPPKSSRSIRIGEVKRRKQGRLLELLLFVPERGTLTVDSPRLGWKLETGPTPPPWRGGEFRWKLKIWPGNGAAGKRIRNELAKAGRSAVDLHLTYQETGRLAVKSEKELVFLRPHRPRS